MKCADKKCTSGLPGMWEPVILLWAEGLPIAGYQPASVTVGMHVCESCRKSMRPRHLLSDDLKRKLKAGFYYQGKAQPDFKTAKLTFTLADSFQNGGVKI